MDAGASLTDRRIYHAKRAAARQEPRRPREGYHRIHRESAAADIPEVDFRNGVRGKHYKQYLASMVTVQIHPDVAQFSPIQHLQTKAFASCCGSAAFAKASEREARCNEISRRFR